MLEIKRVVTGTRKDVHYTLEMKNVMPAGVTPEAYEREAEAVCTILNNLPFGTFIRVLRKMLFYYVQTEAKVMGREVNKCLIEAVNVLCTQTKVPTHKAKESDDRKY